MTVWRYIRKFLLWSLGLMGISLALLIVLQWQTQIVTNTAKAYLDHALKGKARVEYAEISGSLLRSVKFKKLSVTTPGGFKLSVDYLQLQYRLLPLLHNRIEISRVVADHLLIELPPAAHSGQPDAPFSLDSLLARLQTHYLPHDLLESLPFFDIKNVEVTASSVRVKNRPLTFTHIRLDLARLHLQPRAVYIMLSDLSGVWQEPHLQLKSLSFVLKGDTASINLSQGELHTKQSDFVFNALLAPVTGLNFNITQFKLNLNEFDYFLEISPVTPAIIRGECSVSGNPLRFGLQGALKAQIGQRKIRRFLISARYDRGEIYLDRFQIHSNAGMLTAKGYWNHQKHIIGSLHFQNVNLQHIRSIWPTTHLNGKLNINASHLFLNRLNGVGTLLIYHSLIDTIRIDSLHFKMTARRGFLQFTPPSFIRIDDSARFYFAGTMDPQQNIDFSLLTFDNHLNHLLRDLGGQDLHGTFDGRLHLYGPLKNPNFSGNLFLPKLRYNDMVLDSLRFNLFIAGLLRQRYGDGTFKIASGYFGKYPIDSISFHLHTDKNLIRINNLQFVSQKNYFRTSLLVHWASDSLSVKIFPFQIQYENYWIRARDSLLVTSDFNEATIEDWEFEGPQQSEMSINGFYNLHENDLQTFVTLKNVKIDPFERLANTQLNLKGRLNGYAEILTPFTDPNFDVDLRLDSLKIGHVALGTVLSKWHYANGRLSVDSLQLRQQDGVIKGQGSLAMSSTDGRFALDNTTQAEFSLSWQQLHIKRFARLFKGLHRLAGISQGNIVVRGSGNAPIIHAQIALNRFSVNRFTGDSLQINVHYKDNRIVLDHFSVILDSSHFSATGWQQYHLALNGPQDNILNEPFQLHLFSQDNQLLFLGNVNNSIESIQGPYLLDLTLGGTPAKPGINEGTIRLDNGEILLSMIRDPITDVQFMATIKNSILNIERFSAHSSQEKDFWQKAWAFISRLMPWGKSQGKEGTLQASGAIDLSDLSAPEFDLSLKLNQFYIDYFLQNISAVVSSDNLIVQGRDTILVQGDLYIPKGVFELDLNQIKRNIYLSEAVPTPEPPFIALNLQLQIPGNFVVTSSPLDLTNNFRIIFAGNLQVTMQPPSTSPQIQGTLEAVSGKYASWNQNFVVESATIDFKNNPTINPDIHFEAFKIVGNRTFRLSLLGSLDNLRQEIHVLENGQEINMSYLDKIALLTLGADISTLQTNIDSTLRNVGESIATTSILTAIERGAERFTGLDKVEINSNTSLIDLNRLRLNNGLSDASIAFGKYLTSDLYVEYRTHFGSGIPAPRLSWEAGNRIGLQYRFNRYWSLDSYYEKTDHGNTRIKFGLNWEYSF